MKIYNYQPTTGLFSEVSEARESPLEPGVYLLPAFSTKLKPPVTPEGKQAVFKVDKWELQDTPEDVSEEQINANQAVSVVKNKVQQMLDSKAMQLGFDSVLEAMTYAEESAVPKFQEQAKSLRAWRSLVWQKYDEYLAECNKKRDLYPDFETLKVSLPAFKDTVEAPEEL